MPTENRSSNTEMVSVPRGLLQSAAREPSGEVINVSRRHALATLRDLLAQPAPQPHAEPCSYPPCDYCGITPDYHPWHGSGMINGVENRHIHACEGCRGKLPAHPGQPRAEPIAWMVGTAFWWTKEEAERDAAAMGLAVTPVGPISGKTAEQNQGEPAACAHEWTDDGEFMLICTACGAQEDHDPKWRDMATAPRDGTLVRLLVEFTEHATEDSDAMPSPTIGANSFDHTGDDAWQFAGWSWEQDCFTQGAGEPVGWLPLLYTPHADPGEVERLREESASHNDARQTLAAQLRASHAKLAERDALLREVLEFIDDGVGRSDAEWAAIQKARTALSASAEPIALPDPLGCNECAHADCGKFDGPRQVECRAMADNACARPGAIS